MTRFTVAVGVATVAAFAAGAAFVVAPTRPPSAPTVTGPEPAVDECEKTGEDGEDRGHDFWTKK